MKVIKQYVPVYSCLTFRDNSLKYFLFNSQSLNGGEGEITMEEAPPVAAEVEKNGVD